MNLFTIHGIKVKANWWFLLLLFIYLILDIWIQAIGVFLVVMWHEIWHVIIAKANDLQVREIELLPFGGVAKIDNLVGKEGNTELKVALAGPLSNFFLAGFIAAGLYWGWFYHPLAYFIFMYNIIIGAFNLLPVLPLDGGRIIRGYLANRWGLLKTTKIMSKLSQGIAAIMLLVGLAGIYTGLSNFNLMIIAIFVWWGAKKEREQAFYYHWRHIFQKKNNYLLNKVLPGAVLVTRPNLMLRDVLPMLKPNHYHLINVIDEQGKQKAVITEEQLLTLLEEGKYDTTMSQLIK